jgi:hypothetical protein
MASTADPWEDEGFGGEDDWAAGESLESDLEDDDGEELEGSDDEYEGDEELDLGL